MNFLRLAGGFGARSPLTQAVIGLRSEIPYSPDKNLNPTGFSTQRRHANVGTVGRVRIVAATSIESPQRSPDAVMPNESKADIVTPFRIRSCVGARRLR